MKQYDTAVIGGGAAGLTAAICAARNGAQTVIIEHMDRVGKKFSQPEMANATIQTRCRRRPVTAGSIRLLPGK